MLQPTHQSVTPSKFVDSSSGVIYSYTTVREAPAGFEEQAPYLLALVKLDAGAMVTAQLTDVDSGVSIGDRVEMVTRRLSAEGKQGTIVYGYKFRPVLTV